MGQTLIETLHAEFCKILLHVQRKTTSNACRAEVGQYPLIIKATKIANKFWKHLKYNDPLSYHYQAPQCQELSKEKSPLIQLVLGLSSQTCSTNTLKPQDQKIQSIRINRTTTQSKQNTLLTGKQAQSKRQCCLALNGQYTVAKYLTMVSDEYLRKTQAQCTSSVSTALALRRGNRKTQLPVEEWLCNHCTTADTETELHFLTKCKKYKTIRECHFQRPL